MDQIGVMDCVWLLTLTLPVQCWSSFRDSWDPLAHETEQKHYHVLRSMCVDTSMLVCHVFSNRAWPRPPVFFFPFAVFPLFFLLSGVSGGGRVRFKPGWNITWQLRAREGLGKTAKGNSPRPPPLHLLKTICTTEHPQWPMDLWLRGRLG